MPEMLTVLKLASEALEAVYDSSYCETCTDDCAEVDCVLWRARRDCDAALAKLEGGANE